MPEAGPSAPEQGGGSVCLLPRVIRGRVLRLQGRGSLGMGIKSPGLRPSPNWSCGPRGLLSLQSRAGWGDSMEEGHGNWGWVQGQWHLSRVEKRNGDTEVCMCKREDMPSFESQWLSC